MLSHFKFSFDWAVVFQVLLGSSLDLFELILFLMGTLLAISFVLRIALIVFRRFCVLCWNCSLIPEIVYFLPWFLLWPTGYWEVCLQVVMHFLRDTHNLKLWSNWIKRSRKGCHAGRSSLVWRRHLLVHGRTHTWPTCLHLARLFLETDRGLLGWHMLTSYKMGGICPTWLFFVWLSNCVNQQSHSPPHSNSVLGHILPVALTLPCDIATRWISSTSSSCSWQAVYCQCCDRCAE